MAHVALPIGGGNQKPMQTTLPIFEGEANADSPVRPISIDIVIRAETASLTPAEVSYQKKNEIHAIPSSFDSAERFCNILRNPPPAGQFSRKYTDAINEYIGLLCIFACRRLFGLNLSSKTIDLSENSESAVLRGLGTQFEQHGGSKILTYFCIDDNPFAYIYKNCIIPIKDKDCYRIALLPVPFFSSTKGKFNKILAASEDASNNETLLVRQLLYAFFFDKKGRYNINGAFLCGLGAPYLDALERIANAAKGDSYLSLVKVRNEARSFYDVLMNAPSCEELPEKLFSDNLLLLHRNSSIESPCFGEVTYDVESFNVVNPMSKEFCLAISGSKGRIVFENPYGAPDCTGSVPDVDGRIVCRFRLKINGYRITVPKMYSIMYGCRKSDADGMPIENINIGVDCHINPCPEIPSIFRRYIVWNCPECLSLSFDREYGTFPVTHLNDNAFVAIAEPEMFMPEFAFVSLYGTFMGSIHFPPVIEPVPVHGNTPTAIYLDFGTTNTICLVEYGENHSYVDIKEFVRMVTGDNAEFRVFHLLSDRENDGTLRSMAICSIKENRFHSPLYRAHALNAGMKAIEYGVKEIIRQKIEDKNRANRNGPLDLVSVNVIDNLKWSSDDLANECYRAVVGSIFSSALAKILRAGYNTAYTEINISVPSSMDTKDLTLTKNRVKQALTGIRANLDIKYLHYESTATAFYFLNDKHSNVTIGNHFNVGVDIGGGSIDLFTFRSKIGHQGNPIPACIESVKNAAGRKILSETFVQAINEYKLNKVGRKTVGNPFFKCFLPDNAPPPSLVNSSDAAAICITETFIPNAEFNEKSDGAYRCIISTFRRNVLLKTIAVLLYAVEFVKISWKNDISRNTVDFSQAEVNIILCGNGSNIWSKKWAGVSKRDRIRIRDFLKKRIGCHTLYIQASKHPKKETVMGMRYIMKRHNSDNDGNHNMNPFAVLDIPTTLGCDDLNVVWNYVDNLIGDMIDSRLLHVSGENDTLDRFNSLLKKEVTVGRVRKALDYVLNNDNVLHKGNELFLADVFLRLMLDLPFINANVDKL